jgi:hypothetical protein
MFSQQPQAPWPTLSPSMMWWNSLQCVELRSIRDPFDDVF